MSGKNKHKSRCSKKQTNTRIEKMLERMAAFQLTGKKPKQPKK